VLNLACVRTCSQQVAHTYGVAMLALGTLKVCGVETPGEPAGSHRTLTGLPAQLGAVAGPLLDRMKNSKDDDASSSKLCVI
jgi:hypothetical protein